eukprot:3295450-Amphidinium_carterae.1
MKELLLHGFPKRERRCYFMRNVKDNGLFLERVPKHLRDKGLVLAACKDWGGCLKLASVEQRNDKEIVLAA